jgi:hypothetical protein
MCSDLKKWRCHFAWGEFILRVGEQNAHQQTAFIKLWCEHTSGVKSISKHRLSAHLSILVTVVFCETDGENSLQYKARL